MMAELLRHSWWPRKCSTRKRGEGGGGWSWLNVCKLNKCIFQQLYPPPPLGERCVPIPRKVVVSMLDEKQRKKQKKKPLVAVLYKMKFMKG